MKNQKSAEQVVNEAFENNTVRGLFKELYLKSPVGKEKFQEIAKSFGEEALKDQKIFLEFAEKVCFSGIDDEYSSNDGSWIGTEYHFDGLFGILNIPA